MIMSELKRQRVGISWIDNYFPVIGISILYLTILRYIGIMLLTSGTALNTLIEVYFPNSTRSIVLVFLGVVLGLLIYLAVLAARYLQHPKKFARSFYRGRYYGYFVLSLLIGQVFHYETFTFYSRLSALWLILVLALFEWMIPYITEKQGKPFSTNSQLDYFRFYWFFFYITFSWLVEAIFSAWGNWVILSILSVLLGSNLAFFLKPVRNRDWFMQYFFWIQIAVGVLSSIDGLLWEVLGFDLIQGFHSVVSILFAFSMVWYVYFRPETLLKLMTQQLQELGLDLKHLRKIYLQGIMDPERPDHLFIAPKADGMALLFLFETSKAPTFLDIDSLLELKEVIERSEEVIVELQVMVVWVLKEEEVRRQAEGFGIHILSPDDLS